jgi:hypothetical protein
MIVYDRAAMATFTIVILREELVDGERQTVKDEPHVMDDFNIALEPGQTYPLFGEQLTYVRRSGSTLYFQGQPRGD